MLDRVHEMCNAPTRPKRFNDTEDGARSALKSVLDGYLWRHMQITNIVPDPQVRNVWLVEGTVSKTKDDRDVKFIVYLDTAYGVDFEEVC